MTATGPGTSNSLGWRTTASQSVQIDLPTYERADVTFSVDMSNAGLAAGDRVNLNGSFQDNNYDGTHENPNLANWCGECGWNEMSDADGDGVCLPSCAAQGAGSGMTKDDFKRSQSGLKGENWYKD